MRPIMIASVTSTILALAPASAMAEEFFGGTSKGRDAYVRTGPDDRVRALAIEWRTGNCTRSGWSLKRTTTYAVPPLDRSRPGFFVDRGQYRVEFEDARVRYRIGARGRMVGDDRWRGTFAAKAFVNFHDGSEMTCRLRVGWHAERRGAG